MDREDYGDGRALQDLHQEITRLQEELDVANDEKTRAAEYGLLALEEKQQLQDQYDELEAAHLTTRNELDHTLVLLDDLQQERSQKEHQEESLRSNLFAESERRESQLVDANNELQDLVNKLRQSLRTEAERRQHAETDAKQLQEAENDHLLSRQSGADRTADLGRRCQKAEEEAGKLRERLAATEQSQVRASQLEESVKLQEVEHERLVEHANRLTEELRQAHVDASQAFSGLKEEQEKCRHLEMKLEEMEVSALGDGQGLGQSENMFTELSHATMVTPPLHGDGAGDSAASPANVLNDSLMSELQVTLGAGQDERVRELEELLEERNTSVADLNKQLQALQTETAEFQTTRAELDEKRAAVNDLTNDVAKLKLAGDPSLTIDGETMTHGVVKTLVCALKESVKQITLELKEKEALLKQPQDGSEEHSRLTKKIESLEAERSTLLLDAEERSEMLRIELFGVREEKDKLSAAQDELDKRYIDLEKRCRSSEEALSAHRDTVATLTRDAQNLILDVDSITRLAASLTSKRDKAEDISHQSTSTDGSLHQTADPKQLLAALRDKVRIVKSSVENVLRSSLEKHAVSSSSGGTSSVEASPRAGENGWSEDSKRHAQMRIEKLKRELKTRANEISTLRTVMLANRSTAQAALQREKAAAERKIREADERAVRARADLEKVQRDNSQMATMRSMFSERCEEYIRQVVNFKRVITDLTMEKNELSMLLERAIAQKVRLTEKLEEYDIENERIWSIPQALQATKV